MLKAEGRQALAVNNHLMQCLVHYGLLLTTLAAPSIRACAAQPAPRPTATTPLAFTAVSAEVGGTPAPIVVNDDAAGSRFGHPRLQQMNLWQAQWERGYPVFAAIRMLQEAILRMTGREPPVLYTSDLSRGIVLTLLEHAPQLKQDAEITTALKNTGQDAYNANEAFYIRTEAQRVLVVANQPAGLAHGVGELLDSQSYEVLGMGPNWTHVPDYRHRVLRFQVRRADRPGFYIRELKPMGGQGRGVGTLFGQPLPHPADEAVEQSLLRWQWGARILGSSMPPFPGHALQSRHSEVIDAMRRSRQPAGFLVPHTSLAPEAERPMAAPANEGHLWINSETAGPAAGKVFISDGKTWVEQDPRLVYANLDLSIPLVRQVILEHFKSFSELHFKSAPDDLFIYGTDPEDGGGYADLANLLKHKNWYPEYLKKSGLPWGRPYVLHNFKGLQQPREIWDPASASDNVFAFNNWLLHEYDRWIDSLPVAERRTTSGKDKKAQVRASLYSYNYHDVPPNFNVDSRVRVQIAGFAKHRGWGKWKNIKTNADLARAFSLMLPREPAGDYWILSQAYFGDYSPEGIGGSRTAATIHHDIQTTYDAGFRALSLETDFNFGKQGLEYYLYAKMLWNPRRSAAQLNYLRERWMQRAFGSGWLEMKKYYDFLAPENNLVNAPNNWGQAIRFIAAADELVDAEKEPEAQKRLDDLKQYWYFYYLVDSGQAHAGSVPLRELVWKGQMSYMTAMYVVTRRFFNTISAAEAAGEAYNQGPAHYTGEETAAWWNKVLAHWPVTPVTTLAEMVLANGRRGAAVDTNDLVAVEQFQGGAPDVPFFYDSGYMKRPVIYTVATQPAQVIGFTLWWPHQPSDNYYRARDLYYGISRWDAERRTWVEVVDQTMIFQPSRPLTGKDGKEHQLVEVRYKAPQAGTYRLDLGAGGNMAYLTTSAYDAASGQWRAARGHTYTGTLQGHTQTAAWVYLPRGMRSLDLEVWSPHGGQWVQLHTGLPATGLNPTRRVDIGKRGTHRITLEPGEDGSLVSIGGNAFAFPYLYSVPMLWAKSPAALLVPRAVAQADGLTLAR